MAGNTGGAPTIAPTCQDGVVTYDRGGGQLATHTCPEGCEIRPTAPDSARCTTANAGEKRWETCLRDEDCIIDASCLTKARIALWSDITCQSGVCVPKGKQEQDCPANTVCNEFGDGAQCNGAAGTTSGGFLWSDQPTCREGKLLSQPGGAVLRDCARGCEVVSQTSGQCIQAIGEAPERSCARDADCEGASLCEAGDPGHERRMTGGVCSPKGLCKWSGVAVKACRGGSSCLVSSCAR
jgi:hypothetical protein